MRVRLHLYLADLAGEEALQSVTVEVVGKSAQKRPVEKPTDPFYQSPDSRKRRKRGESETKKDSKRTFGYRTEEGMAQLFGNAWKPRQASAAAAAKKVPEAYHSLTWNLKAFLVLVVLGEDRRGMTQT